MNSFLFNRAIGNVSPQAFQRAQTTQLLHGLQPAPEVSFGAEPSSENEPSSTHIHTIQKASHVTHKAGVNAIAIDRFEGRWYAVSVSSLAYSWS